MIDINQLEQFVDIPSILIVVGGTLATVIMGNPMKTLVKFPKHLSIILNQKSSIRQALLMKWLNLLRSLRKKWIAGIGRAGESAGRPFFKKSIMLIVDGNDSEKVREMLTSDIDQLSARHDDVASMYEKRIRCGAGIRYDRHPDWSGQDAGWYGGIKHGSKRYWTGYGHGVDYYVLAVFWRIWCSTRSRTTFVHEMKRNACAASWS